MIVQWNDSLLTGMDEVDNQHKELIYRINILFKACNKGKGREEVIKIFSFLEDYVKSHFKSEQTIMYKYNYPHHLSHIAEHQQFISVVAELKRELEEKCATGQFVLLINRKIVQWFLSHINKEDKILAKYIREHSQ